MYKTLSMSAKIKAISKVALGFTVLFFAAGCHKEPSPKPEFEHLIDYTLVSVYPKNTIEAILSAESVIYPEMSGIIDNIQYDVQVYKVRYKTHYKDSVITASGLICLPSAQKSFPVISFQNGTNTAFSNAPSAYASGGNYLMLEYMASNGYVILMTDYTGFGSSSAILHPYYNRTATNNAVIDLLLAFIELSKSGKIKTTGNNQLFLMGYSQGGGATLSALDEIEHEGIPEMSVEAVSCGAGAYNLTNMTNYVLGLETFPGPLYFPYFIYSEQKYGVITGPLTSFFKEPYASRIPELFDGLHTNDQVNAGLNDTITALLTTEMVDNFNTAPEFNELRTALSVNSIAAWNTTNRINLYHGTDDLNVPPQQSADIYNDFMQSGASPDLVRYYPLNGLTHETGLLPWGIQTIIWFNTLSQNQ